MPVDEKNEPPGKKRGAEAALFGLMLGSAASTTAWLLTGNIFWMSLGLGLGVSLGMLFGRWMGK
jgi:hypothetical protein